MSFTHPNELHTAFAHALGAGDVKSLVNLYEAGAVQVQRDGSLLSGPEDLAEAFAGLLGSGVTMHGDPQKAIVAGDIALTSTHYEFTASDRDGEDAVTRVVTAEVSRRQADGSWRVVIDAPGFT